MKKRTLTLVVSLVLVALVAVGGTLAWLTASTETVKNTFTVGEIKITLDEAKVNANGEYLDKDGNVVTDPAAAERIATGGNSYNIVPGYTYPKDPTVTVKANSEACYVFVEVIKSDNYDAVITSQIAEGWTNLEDGVYYQKFTSKVTADQKLAVLAGNTVTVKDIVTKDSVTSAPTIEFKAYAVQLYKSNGVEFSPADAWNEVN